MTIAEQKKKENIVEYILYLWQMQDLVRAADFDLSAIRAFVGSDGSAEASIERELEWFGGLIQRMKQHKVTEKGNVPEIDEVMAELSYLHHTLLEILKDKNYLAAWDRAKGFIAEFIKRSDNASMSPVEAALTAMYGMLVMRLQKKTVSAETKTAIDTFRELLVVLARQYRDMQHGQAHFSLN